MKANIKSFLFQNKNIKQTVLKNTFWLTLAEAIAKILSLFLVIYIARALGAMEYGEFIFALSFASIISILSDLGVMDISTREFSRDKENEKHFSSIFTLELVLCAVAFLVAVVTSFFVTGNPAIRYIAWILALFVLTNSLFGIIFSFLRARQKMEYEAIIKICQAVANATVIFSVIFFAPSAKNLSYAYLVSNVVVLVLLLVAFNLRVQPIVLRWEKTTLGILKKSWPLSFGFMPAWLYISINSVLLGYVGLITQNGWYGAASKIAVATIIPANLIIKSFYPILSKFFVSSKSQLQKSWDYFAESMVFLVVPILVAGIALAPKIISFFYGASFAPSSLALQLLIIVIALSFLNYPYTIMLVVADKQKDNFVLIIIGFIINILLGFIFIKLYGFYGVVLATIIASLLVFLLTAALCWHHRIIEIFNYELLRPLATYVVSGLCMYGVILLKPIYGLNIIVVLLIGSLVYLASLLMLQVFFLRRKLFNF